MCVCVSGNVGVSRAPDRVHRCQTEPPLRCPDTRHPPAAVLWAKLYLWCFVAHRRASVFCAAVRVPLHCHTAASYSGSVGPYLLVSMRRTLPSLLRCWGLCCCSRGIPRSSRWEGVCTAAGSAYLSSSGHSVAGHLPRPARRRAPSPLNPTPLPYARASCGSVQVHRQCASQHWALT